MRRRLALAVLLASALPALADPVAYRLQPELSTVGFSYVMAGQKMNGQMPVQSADIMLDLDQPANSRVAAVLRADRANAGPDYATVAMQSAEVLDTAEYPTISFRSTGVTETAGGAVVDGEITIRGVTRPIRLQAQFFRQQGSAEGDQSKMSIVLKGAISRQDFGAAGYGGLVGDRIDLTILARVERAG
jgi:polyisoprenoid-binding protein YceI